MFLVVSILALGLSSCGGSSDSSAGAGGGTTVTVSFSSDPRFPSATPRAVAEQIGASSWAGASLQNGQLILTIPESTTKYSIAYLCSSGQGAGTAYTEVIIQATTQDSTSYSPSSSFCSSNTAIGSASGTFDASAIPGTANVGIYGVGGSGTTGVGGITGVFSAILPSGTNDIAAVAYDASYNVLAAKIVRSQTVPFNGLSVVFSPEDATAAVCCTIFSIPPGFNDNSSPSFYAQYVTTNGTSFYVSALSSYVAVASADSQPGDYYSLSFIDDDAATNQAIIGLRTSATAGPFTFALPPPLQFSAPVPSAFPSFDIPYSGFSDAAVELGDLAAIQWVDTSNDTIEVFATSAYQNGSTTLAIPDLSGVGGFLPSPPSGATVLWTASASGGTYQTFESIPASGSFYGATINGLFTEP